MQGLCATDSAAIQRTRNSAIRSADPENTSLEPNMQWIRCTICEIFAFKLHCDLETGIWGHSRSSNIAPLDQLATKTPPQNQTSRRSANRLRRYGHFCIIQNGHQPPPWILSNRRQAVRSIIADPENTSIEPNMEGIGCTVCEIFTFKLYYDLKLVFRVTQGH